MEQKTYRQMIRERIRNMVNELDKKMDGNQPQYLTGKRKNDMRATPNKKACKWCEFKGTEHCKWGV